MKTISAKLSNVKSDKLKDFKEAEKELREFEKTLELIKKYKPKLINPANDYQQYQTDNL